MDDKKYEIKCSDCGSKWKIGCFEELTRKCPACSGRLGDEYCINGVFRWFFTDIEDEDAYFVWWKKERDRERARANPANNLKF